MFHRNRRHGKSYLIARVDSRETDAGDRRAAGDVTDAAAVAAVIDEILATSGRVDVILHAAGIERSRTIDKKPVEEFDLIFAVKADGLFNLLRATADLDVGAVVEGSVRQAGDRFELIMGERRFRASKLAGRKTVPAIAWAG